MLIICQFSLIPKFAELANAGDDGYSNIAIGVDIRSGHALAELDSVLMICLISILTIQFCFLNQVMKYL